MANNFSSKALDKIIEENIKRKVFTSCQIAVIQRLNKKTKFIFKKQYGKKYKYFDLSSVTKAIFTTPVIVQLTQEKKLSLNDNVEKHIAFFTDHKIGKIKIKELLNQTSGLIWWRPFHQELVKFPLEFRALVLKNLFQKEKVKKKSKTEYSDLNFIILGWIIENIEKMSLDKVFQKRIAKPLKLKNIFFQNTKKRLAPVGHPDQNGLSMGGVSSHSGLVSSLTNLTLIVEELLKAHEGNSKLFDKKVISVFSKRAVNKARGDWSLGWMIPSRPESTGGSKISLNAIGFPGYTGPSIWIDLKRHVGVVVLINRSDSTKNIRPFRMSMHDLIWEQFS